jgi:hypothetical protein
MDALQSFTVNRRCSPEQIQHQLDIAVAKCGWAILTFHKVSQGEGAGKIERGLWIACLNSLSTRRDRLWIATVEAVAAYITARQSARVVYQSADQDTLSLALHGAARRNSEPPVTLSASVRLPHSWRFARLIDAEGSVSDYRVQQETIRIPVWADGRPFRITKLG